MSQCPFSGALIQNILHLFFTSCTSSLLKRVTICTLFTLLPPSEVTHHLPPHRYKREPQITSANWLITLPRFCFQSNKPLIFFLLPFLLPHFSLGYWYGFNPSDSFGVPIRSYWLQEIRNGNVEKEEKDREREQKEKWPHRDCVKKGQWLTIKSI